MKTFILSVIFPVMITSLSAQNPNKQKEYYKKGIELHDQQLFDEAIATYLEAYNLDSLSELAPDILYEIAFSNHSLKKYADAEKYSRLSIAKDPAEIHKYILLGSILDDSERQEEALEIYHKAFQMAENSDNKKLAGNLSFNMGITYFRNNDFENAEKYLLHAVNSRPLHFRSNFLLAQARVEQQKANLAIFNLFYVIFLDQKEEACNHENTFRFIINLIRRGVDYKNTEKGSIQFDPENKDMGELMRQMLVMAFYLPEKEKEYTDERTEFLKLTKEYFSAMKPMGESTWSTYGERFLHNVAKTDHYETFYCLVTSRIYEESREWLLKNESRVLELQAWTDYSGSENEETAE